MSRIVDEWRKTQDFKQAYKIGDRMADEIERLERLVGLYRELVAVSKHTIAERKVIREQIKKEEQHG